MDAPATPTEAPAPAPADRMVEIAPNIRAPLSALWAAIDPDCKTCHGRGLVMVTTAQGRSEQPCGCAARRHMRRQRQQPAAAPSPAAIGGPPAVGVVIGAERVTERAKARIERLSAQVASLDRQLRERRERLDTVVDPANERQREAAADAQRLADEAEAAERRIVELLALIDEARAAHAAAVKARAEADSVMVGADSEIVRALRLFEESTAGLRRELEKARARLGRAIGYNPEAAPAGTAVA